MARNRFHILDILWLSKNRSAMRTNLIEVLTALFWLTFETLFLIYTGLMSLLSMVMNLTLRVKLIKMINSVKKKKNTQFLSESPP